MAVAVGPLYSCPSLHAQCLELAERISHSGEHKTHGSSHPHNHLIQITPKNGRYLNAPTSIITLFRNTSSPCLVYVSEPCALGPTLPRIPNINPHPLQNRNPHPTKHQPTPYLTAAYSLLNRNPHPPKQQTTSCQTATHSLPNSNPIHTKQQPTSCQTATHILPHSNPLPIKQQATSYQTVKTSAA